VCAGRSLLFSLKSFDLPLCHHFRHFIPFLEHSLALATRTHKNTQHAPPPTHIHTHTHTHTQRCTSIGASDCGDEGPGRLIPPQTPLGPRRQFALQQTWHTSSRRPRKCSTAHLTFVNGDEKLGTPMKYFHVHTHARALSDTHTLSASI